MKKSLMYCCLFVCAMGIFSGCNKDDDKNQSELVGKWNVKEMPMDIVWEAPDNVVIEAGPIKLTVKQLAAMMTPTLNELVQAGLKDVTFTADEKIEATYKKKDSNEWMTAKDYAKYNVKGENKIMLHPDADKVFAEMKGVDPNTLVAAKALFLAGIPVYYTQNGSSIRFYLDTKTVKALKNVLPILLASVKNIPDSVKPLLAKKLPDLLEKSTKVEIGLTMTKAAN
ncbi:hypothetical protein EII41_11515 [Tannerella forsythia]|uniref:DUF4923 domain-containing protein n=2 Tax=Tannerella forsythia TaxID=28112 RepID=A0A3P1YM89_TANFO|nr:hypothetical protein EII41_11515 [Tannerella forsythia]